MNCQRHLCRFLFLWLGALFTALFFAACNSGEQQRLQLEELERQNPKIFVTRVRIYMG